MNFSADKLSLLLSSDWFTGVWSACGLYSALPNRITLQKHCREIVISVVDGCSTYWDVEFSESRALATRTLLLAALDAVKLVENDKAILSSYVKDEEAIREQDTEHDLVLSLCALLVSEHKQEQRVAHGLSDEVITRIEDALNAVRSDTLDEAARAACTKWDVWLSSLTPDLPSFLADVATDLAQQAGLYSKFVASINAGLRPEEIARLSKWIKNAAIELAGAPLVGPLWD